MFEQVLRKLVRITGLKLYKHDDYWCGTKHLEKKNGCG